VIEDAWAAVWHELRRLAQLIAELADRIEHLERREPEE
jgi:hypothetical protein